MSKLHSITDLPETIPIFPLPGALLLPHARLPLNIFEPRYLAMFDDILKTDHRMIGMIQPAEAPEASPDPELHKIGCAGRVIAFSETDDGRYLVTLGGVCRFRMIGRVDGFAPYIRGGVDWAEFAVDMRPAATDPDFDRAGFLATLSRYFDAVRLSSDWDTLKEADEELLINSLSMLCPFEPEEKQALLEAATLQQRRETLLMLMEFALASSAGDDGSIQ